MGNFHPVHQPRSRNVSSSDRRSIDLHEISKKIDEKECVYIAMQSEIDKAISENNKTAMKSLASEIAAHILDLNQIKQYEISSSERGRSQRVIYNFELSLAKLKSIYKFDTAFMKERDSQHSSASFYVDPVEPDIVSDLLKFETRDISEVPHHTFPQNITSGIGSTPTNVEELERSDPYPYNYYKAPVSLEVIMAHIERDFESLKRNSQRTIDDVNEYYQIDKNVFYLYVKVNQLDTSKNPECNEKKFKLLKNIANFRSLLDKKSGELEECRDILQELATLEVLYDSTLPEELESLKNRALIVQTRIEKISWDPGLHLRKFELLKRLARFLETISYATSPSTSVRKSVENLYGNINFLQEEIKHLREQEEAKNISSKYVKEPEVQTEKNSDSAQEPINYCVLKEGDGRLNIQDENTEDIYGNVEIIKQNKHFLEQSNLQRGTVYENIEVIRQKTHNGLASEKNRTNEEPINKRPLPLPRNYDEKMITDLPKYWRRLNELCDKDTITETERTELTEIQKHAEVAKNLFERKIKKICDKFSETIEI